MTATARAAECFEAAGDAGCATDFPLLLESARKDPILIVRVDAVRGRGARECQLQP